MSDGPSSIRPKAAPAPKSTAWVVDDSPLEGELVKRGLMPAHHVVVFDGAAPMLEQLARGDRPDVLVLDWEMPEITGLEACRFVRQTADEASLPIVILTAATMPEDLTTGLSAGANDFVRKPFNHAELIARVDALVRMKRLHERLVVAEADLRREASFREKFLAILAHDLRQPLNVFGIAGEMLGEPELDETMRAKLSKQLLGASGRMQRMIDELLDFSRARPAGGVPLTRIRADLARVVDDVVGEIRTAHPERSIELEVSGPCNGEWDRDRLAQVISNLVENALGHSPAGSAVAVALRHDDERVELAVDNTGPTIPSEELSTLFDAFRRGTTGAKRPRGLGLGLYIVAEIVKAHGGAVAASSADGRTRFVVTFPIAPVSAFEL